MKNKLTLLIALIAITVVSCSSTKQEEAVNEERSISVQTEMVAASDLQLLATFTGSAEGVRQTTMRAKIAESVEKVNVREGQTVKAGQVLIELDQTGATSQYQQAKALAENSEKQYKKIAYLYEQGAVAEVNYDAAKTEYEVDQASFEAAAQLVKIKSPISGVVTSLDVSTGDYSYIGQKLATIADFSEMRVKINVNSRDIHYFRKGASVFVEGENDDGKIEGTVSSVAESADPVTRSFEVEVMLDNKSGQLKPGMFVRVSIVKQDLPGAIAVPRRAILTTDSRDVVYVIVDDRAYQRAVTLGPDVNGSTVVSSGLSLGDQVVTLGQEYLQDSMKVKITSTNGATK